MTTVLCPACEGWSTCTGWCDTCKAKGIVKRSRRMSDTCEKCGCPEGVDGHDVLYREIDELKKAAPNAINNLSKALGSMDAEERAMLCKRIKELEGAVIALHGALHSHHKQAVSADKCAMDYCQMAHKVISQ